MVLSSVLFEIVIVWSFPPRALGVARQRVPCAQALLTRFTIVGMCFLLCTAAAGGSDCSLAAKGIAASGQDVGVMAEAIEQRRCELFVAEHLDHSENARLVVMMVERRS